MGLGELLGSLSPGFGLLSGKGMFGGGASGGLNGLAGSGLFGLLGLLLHHSDHTPTAAPAPSPPALPGSGSPAPSAGQAAPQMPGIANGANPLAAIGSSMQSRAAPDPGVQLSPLPQQSNGLHALLQQILSQ